MRLTQIDPRGLSPPDHPQHGGVRKLAQRIWATTGARADFLKRPRGANSQPTGCPTEAPQPGVNQLQTTESQVSSRVSVNFPTRAAWAYLCMRTQIWGKEEITEAAHLARFTNAVGGRRQGARSKERGTDHIQHASQLSKGRLCGLGLAAEAADGGGAAGPGRYLAHPTPHDHAALAAPRSREKTARVRTRGRGGGRRRQGGARCAFRRRRGIAGQLSALRRERPSPPRQDAHRARAPEP